MCDSHQVVLERDGELAVLSAAGLAAGAGHGALVPARARETGHPVTLAIALRVHAATVPHDEAGAELAEAALTEAAGLLEAAGARYELALTLTDLRARLRRAGRRTDARAPLRRALDLAQRTGATPLAEQARRELLAAGARPAEPPGPTSPRSSQTGPPGPPRRRVRPVTAWPPGRSPPPQPTPYPARPATSLTVRSISSSVL